MTSELFPVNRPETSRTNQHWTELHQFAARPDVNNLLKYFGFHDPVTLKATPEDQTAWTLRQMSRFASNNPLLNPRGGEERSNAASIKLTQEQKDLILETAESLNMREETRPSKENYDALVAFGAGGAHAYERVAYLKETGVKGNTIYCAVGDERYDTPPIEAMGKMSPKEDPESEQRRQAYITKMLSLKEKYPNYVDENGKTIEKTIPEFEFMLAAAEIIYGTRQYDGTYSLGHDITIRQENGDKTVKYLATEDHPEIILIEAHNKSDPENRVRSEDTLTALVPELQKRNQRDLLLSTNAIFRPFQDTASKRILTLPYGITTETIGFAMKKTPSFDTPERYVQEITAEVIERHRLADLLLRPTRHFRSEL